MSLDFTKYLLVEKMSFVENHWSRVNLALLPLHNDSRFSNECPGFSNRALHSARC